MSTWWTDKTSAHVEQMMARQAQEIQEITDAQKKRIDALHDPFGRPPVERREVKPLAEPAEVLESAPEKNAWNAWFEALPPARWKIGNLTGEFRMNRGKVAEKENNESKKDDGSMSCL